MKKLHKKLEKVAEHIDLTNPDQTSKLKELASVCGHSDLAEHMESYEKAALLYLKKQSSGYKSIEDSIVAGSENFNSKVDNLIGKLQSQDSFILSELDIAQIGDWLSSGGKSYSLIDILGDDSDVEKTIDRGMAITAEVLKQGMELKEAQEKEPELLVNSIKTPDGAVLTSRSRHDYVCHTDKITGTTYCLDGGLDYRRIIAGGGYQDLSVYSDDPFEKIRESLERVHRGKNLDQPMKLVVLKDMSDAWLNALIVWIEDNQPNNKYKKYYLQEIEYRKENGITVKEEEEC